MYARCASLDVVLLLCNKSAEQGQRFHAKRLVLQWRLRMRDHRPGSRRLLRPVSRAICRRQSSPGGLVPCSYELFSLSANMQGRSQKSQGLLCGLLTAQVRTPFEVVVNCHDRGQCSIRRRTSRCSGRSPSAPAAERQTVRQTFSSVKGSGTVHSGSWRWHRSRLRTPCRLADLGKLESRVRGRRAREPRSTIAVRQHACPRSMRWRTGRCSGRSRGNLPRT